MDKMKKPKIDEEKLKGIILNELKQYKELEEAPSWANQGIIVVTNNLVLEITKKAEEWLIWLK